MKSSSLRVRAAGLAFVLSAAAFAQAPSNDLCTGAIAVFDGVNPSPPTGALGVTYTNVNANNSLAFGVSCAAPINFNRDVFFTYTSTTTGLVDVSTCTPAGFPAGTLLNSLIAVYNASACPAGGADIACNDDSCGALSVATVTMTLGATYLIRVGSLTVQQPGTFYLTIRPRIGDECSSAILVTPGTYDVTSFGATLSADPPPAGCSGSFLSGSDVWFSVTPASTCQLQAVVSGLGADVVALYGGTCGFLSPLDCDASGTLDVLTVGLAGTTYFIRVGRVGPGVPFTLSVTCPPAPANDDCGAASALPLGFTNASTAGATPSNDLPGLCGALGATSYDVWHVFTPALSCDFAFDVTGSGADVIAAYTGTCGALTQIGCDTAGALAIVAPVVAGQPVLLRVGTSTAPGGAYTARVRCQIEPLNDECVDATPVFDGVNPSAPAGLSGATFTNVNATNSAGYGAPVACSGVGNPGVHDVFFSYTSTIDGPVRVATTTPAGFAAGTHVDTLLEAYSACAPGTPLACADGNPANVGLSELVFTAAFGTTYLIRVSTSTAFGAADGTFYLTVVPANDACSAAQVLGEGVVHGSTKTAAPTSPEPAGCPFGATSVDVWFTLTPSTTCEASLTTNSVDAAAQLAVYTGTCGALSTFRCANNATPGASTTFTAVAGTTYFIRVAATTAALGGPFTLTVVCPTPPVYDACANAATIVRGVNPSAPNGSSGSFFTNVGAFNDAGAGCASHLNDVWFKYVAVGSGPATFTTNTPAGFAAGSLTDTLLSIFDVCGGTQLACDDDSGDGALSFLTLNLVSGTTYFVRVSSRSAVEGTFYVTVRQDFALKAESPLGVGSLLLRHENGTPSAAYVTLITLNQGAFPNGWLLGIDPTLTEVYLQVGSAAAPFFGVLSPSGTTAYGPVPGLPSLTFYAGSAEFTPIGTIGRTSAPVLHVIP